MKVISKASDEPEQETWSGCYFEFLFILVISMLFSRGSVAKITQNCLEILRIRLAGKRGIVLQSLYAPHGYRQ